MREALAERNLMLNHICPHLARPVSFLYPLQHRVWERLYVGAGVLLYDQFASAADSPLPRHTHLSRKTALEMAPALAGGALVGAVRYWTRWSTTPPHDDARPDRRRPWSPARQQRESKISHPRGRRVSGIEATDLEDGRELRINARRVINATGVWSDDIQAMAGDRGLDVKASKDPHRRPTRPHPLRDRVDPADREKCASSSSPGIAIGSSGPPTRPGTCDAPTPAACSSDIDYLLTRVNSVLADPLNRRTSSGFTPGSALSSPASRMTRAA